MNEPRAGDPPAAAPRRPGLRETTRKAVRDEITSVAMNLFVRRGFDATTVDDVARDAGISSRTFFRYFPTKEDVVLGDVADTGARLLDLLRNRPDDEPPWDALHAALRLLLAELDDGRGPAVWRIAQSAPSLRARQMEKHQQWVELLAPEVVRRLRSGTSPPPLMGRVLVSAALACMDEVLHAWAGDPAVELVDLLDDVMTAVPPLLAPSHPPIAERSPLIDDNPRRPRA